jgi:hypothetical protein
VNSAINWPWKTALTAGMPCTRSACAIVGLWSTSILARIQEPPPSIASFSSTGESCLHGPHHSAQRSRTTGTSNERSITSAWKVASVTSTTAVTAASAACPFAAFSLARWAASLRAFSADRSTARASAPDNAGFGTPLGPPPRGCIASSVPPRTGCQLPGPPAGRPG